MASRWLETSPTQLAEWLAQVPVPWAFAGGWALDLWAGQQSRPHSDIEIACRRADLPALGSALPDFEIAVAQNKQLSPWRPEAPPPFPFSLWLRRQRRDSVGFRDRDRGACRRHVALSPR
jgi:hypothetical protein